MNQNKCVICNEELKGGNHNPSPVATSGYCCDACNKDVVVHARLCALSEERHIRAIEMKVNVINNPAFVMDIVYDAENVIAHYFEYIEIDSKGDVTYVYEGYDSEIRLWSNKTFIDVMLNRNYHYFKSKSRAANRNRELHNKATQTKNEIKARRERALYEKLKLKYEGDSK